MYQWEPRHPLPEKISTPLAKGKNDWIDRARQAICTHSQVHTTYLLDGATGRRCVFFKIDDLNDIWLAGTRMETENAITMKFINLSIKFIKLKSCWVATKITNCVHLGLTLTGDVRSMQSSGSLASPLPVGSSCRSLELNTINEINNLTTSFQTFQHAAQ